MDMTCRYPYSYEGYNDALYAYGNRTNVGAFNISYMYNPLKWLAMGASFSYHSSAQRVYERTTEKLLDSNRNSSYSLVLKARFVYLNREWIRLYGNIGMGIGINHYENVPYYYGYARTYFTGQFTPFGLEVGKNLFGYFEPIGLGSLGMYCVGIGYKF